jgi:hypothetical protein
MDDSRLCSGSPGYILVLQTGSQDAKPEATLQALSQSLAIGRVSGIPDVTRAQIIDTSQQAWPSSGLLGKEGYFRVDRLGLRFHESGRFIEAVQ